MYHYVESGLANVYLASGYTVEEIPGYGEALSVEDLHGLHEAIAAEIITQHRTMRGAEFRFLRLELDLSQRRLAEMLSTNEQSIAKWEKASNMPVSNRAAEKLLRIIYANKSRATKLDRLIESITKSDKSLDEEQVQKQIRLQRDAEGWHQALAA